MVCFPNLKKAILFITRWRLRAAMACERHWNWAERYSLGIRNFPDFFAGGLFHAFPSSPQLEPGSSIFMCRQSCRLTPKKVSKDCEHSGLGASDLGLGGDPGGGFVFFVWEAYLLSTNDLWRETSSEAPRSLVATTEICIFLNWINCSLQAGVSRGGDFAPFRDIACWCWLGQKYNAARNHAKTFFWLPCWFGFAWFYNTLDSGLLKMNLVSQSLYSSGSVKGHNLSCFEVLGRELLVLQKEWKRCAGWNWGKHARITSKKSSHFQCYRIITIPLYQVIP